MRRFLSLRGFARGLFALSLAACSNGDAPTFQSTCIAGAPTAEALTPAQRNSDGSVILPDGRKITPAGTVLTIGGFPISMRVLPASNGRPGDRYVVVSDAAYGDEHLRIVDVQASDPSKAVISDVSYPATNFDSHDPALFYGLVLTKDGQTLYVSDGGYDPTPNSVTDHTKHYNVVEVFGLGSNPPQLIKQDEIHIPFGGTDAAPSPPLPAGLALSADGKTLFVANSYEGTMSVVDLSPGPTHDQEIGRTLTLGVGPYDVLVDDARQIAYVSLWGGQVAGPHLFNDGLQPVDISNRVAPMATGALVPTGKSPEMLIANGETIYVPTADSDAVSTVDESSRMVTSTPVAFDATGLYGSAPNGIALDVAHDRLYTANGGEDAVQAFQLSTMKSLGRVPTAWYPTSVAVLSDGTLLIASAKGLGAGPTDRTPDKDGYMQGTLEIVPMPSTDELQNGDAQVHANVTRPKSYEVQLQCTGADKKFPLPSQKGDPTPIQHVFLIVRENKTYDAVLGDLPTGNGDPALAIFGGDMTPNLHALAARFASLDNFYSLAEQSLQGHEWTTANMANDYVEKAWLTTWGRGTRPLGAFSGGDSIEHLALPESRTAWEALDQAGINYHNYGEITNTSGAIHIYDTSYPGVFFNTGFLDVDKINYVVSNIQDPGFALEPFSYIGLPNDHTVGTTPGKPTPQSMVADNDEATGRFVDALSHSDYWSNSIVFVIEDDPSDGGDHVELHRSPCLAIGPWVKSGYTSSVHYDVPALWHTLTLLLGMDPINQRDANAPAMVDVFAPAPDLRPYSFIPRKIPMDVNPADAPMAEESARIDWSRPDSAPLGRILWKAMKGRDAEPPWGKTPLVRDDDD